MQGVLHQVIHFPNNWPIEVETRVSVSPSPENEKHEVEIFFLPNGSIRVNIIYPNCIETFLSQPIEFPNKNTYILISIINQDKIKVWVNRKAVDESSNTLIITSKTQEKSISEPLPIDSKEVRNACKKWVEWRKNSLLNQKIRSNRKIKPIEEQVKNLEKSLSDLKLFVIDTKTIDSNLPIILVILRALIVWKDNSKNYNPLLFRLAAKIQLALPVFSFPKNHLGNILPNSTSYLQYGNFSISLTKTSEKQIIMDFQETLSNSILIENNDSHFTYLDLIILASNTESYAHFDEAIPIKIDLMKRILKNDNSLLSEFIQTISILTIHYGEIIIQTFNSKNYKIE